MFFVCGVHDGSQLSLNLTFKCVMLVQYASDAVLHLHVISLHLITLTFVCRMTQYCVCVRQINIVNMRYFLFIYDMPCQPCGDKQVWMQQL